MELLGLDKLYKLMKIIHMNGGLRKSLYKRFRFDTLKEGNLMGQDELGNKYYENKRYMIGRSRWVEHADYFNWDYDASQVTPEWSGWLHYRTDKLPCEEPTRARHPWMSKWGENYSGTDRSYVPWSTTQPKCIPWDGRSQASRTEEELQEQKPFDPMN